jgi:methylated-DNA-[protein]-cysteine S-methyltransferase
MTKTRPEALSIAPLSTPLGPAQIVFDRAGVLRAFDWSSHRERMDRLLRRHYGPVTLSEAAAPRALSDSFAAYFAGDARALAAVPWATGGTAFQNRVWRALCEIPAGVTWSYGQLAAHIGSPKAVRAVGLANGANPVGLVVPCHRVIGADRSLTGYGGGLDRKRWLLAHEGVNLDPVGDAAVAARLL